MTGAAALTLAGALPRRAGAQSAALPSPVPLKAAPAERIELAGAGPVDLFEGGLPGPVLKVKRGQPVAVAAANGLKAPLDLTWHGVRVPNALDGVPGLTGPAIAPGGSRDIRFFPPDAGTFWYHAFDPAQARRALAGALIVEEDGPSPFGADHVMLIQTWAPDPTMQVPLITVNGVVSPTLEAPSAARARLRLINASADFLRLHVVDAQSWVIAIDGQPTAPFVLKEGRVQLVPGGRIDLALDVNLNGGSADPIVLEIETTKAPVQLALIAPVGASNLPAPAATPAALPANALPAEIPLAGAVRAELAIGPEAAGLGSFPTLCMLQVGKSGVIALTNKVDAPVAVHFHGMPVRVLDGADDGWKPWWHDTVPVPAKTTVRVAVRPDTPGKWAVIARKGGTGEVLAAAAYEVK
ncbi:multicopper oxidase family protein [Azorhizobium doebereinerae]|uniref:multicopper oxidase family protein n=1 Tax=Azorhizobium doebereinerae TaxID=281091 RepID=UPI0004241B9D|nr:multicopper oxidase domain-containing protein [Azorhizobium doebereinerae]